MTRRDKPNCSLAFVTIVRSYERLIYEPSNISIIVTVFNQTECDLNVIKNLQITHTGADTLYFSILFFYAALSFEHLLLFEHATKWRHHED